MKHVYESRTPRTLVLIPAYKKIDALGNPSMTTPVIIIFNSDRAFTLTDEWAKERGLTLEDAKKRLEDLGGSDIRLVGTFGDKDKTPEPTVKPKSVVVEDGPVVRK
jgi:hypothetical protein